MDTRTLRELPERCITTLRCLAQRVSSTIRVTSDPHAGTLPALLFFAVGLLGGVRIADSELWVRPSLFTLVLALFMLRAFNRHGVLSLERLLKLSTSTVDPKGLLVCLTIIFASAQVFELTTPDAPARIPVYALYSMVLLAFNTQAIAADRTRLLRSFVMIFALAFTFKFVVLPSSPAGGWREFLCEVFTVGMCQPRHPATGYLVLFTLVLYVIALALLAQRASHVSDCPPIAVASGSEHQVKSMASEG